MQTKNLDLQTNLKKLEIKSTNIEEEKEELNIKQLKYINENKLLKNELQTIKEKYEKLDKQIKDDNNKQLETKKQIDLLNNANDKLKDDINILQSSLEKEQTLHVSAKEQLLLEEKQQLQYMEKIRNYEIEIINLEDNLKEERINYENNLIDKQKLENENKLIKENLNKQIELFDNEKINFKENIKKIKDDFMNNLNMIKNNKENNNDTINNLNKELNKLKEELNKKELKLLSFYQSIDKFDNNLKCKKDIECQLIESEMENEKLKSNLHIMNINIENEKLLKDNLINDSNKLKLINEQLKDGIKIIKEEYTKEIFTLNNQLKQLKINYDNDIHNYKNNINQLNVNLNMSEASLISVRENIHSLNKTIESHEKTIDSLKRRLYQEITKSMIMNEKYELCKYQYNIVKKEHLIDKSEEKMTTPITIQQQLNQEIEKNHGMNHKIKILENTNFTQQSHIETLEIRLKELHNENIHLKQSTNQDDIKRDHVNSNNHNKELIDKLNFYENERLIFYQTSQKLSIDLEQSRMIIKERTNELIKLQDEINKNKEKIELLNKQIVELKETNQSKQQTIHMLQSKNCKNNFKNSKLFS